jgi:hypothetical protein
MYESEILTQPGYAKALRRRAEEQGLMVSFADHVEALRTFL